MRAAWQTARVSAHRVRLAFKAGTEPKRHLVDDVGHVGDVSTAQARWECSCGQKGRWTSDKTKASKAADRHEAKSTTTGIGSANV